jgi:hypothetical protein
VRRGAASCRAVVGSCPVAAVVRAAAQVPSPRRRPGWPSAPRRRAPGAVGPLSGWSPARGCPDAGQAGCCPVRAPRSRRGTSVQPVERTSNVQASGVQCPRVRCPGVGVQVSGRTGLRCPRQCRRAVRVALDLEWLGVGAARLGAVGRGAPVSAGGWSPACIGPDGKRWCGGWPCPAATRWTVAQGRHLAGVPAAAPPGRRADTALVQGQGAGRVGSRDAAGAHRSAPAGRLGGRRPGARQWGLDQEVVTTLCGR